MRPHTDPSTETTNQQPDAADESESESESDPDAVYREVRVTARVVEETGVEVFPDADDPDADVLACKRAIWLLQDDLREQYGIPRTLFEYHAETITRDGGADE